MKTLVVTLSLALFIAGCGGQSSTPGKGPLDPQGNWIFTLTDANQQQWIFAGQLFELVPPTVTGNNGMGTISGGCHFGATANGQASGTNTINLTLGATDLLPNQTPPAYSLTGTIADDQQHMSGSFTATSQQGCTSTPSGTWSAQSVPAINGTWTGTVQNTNLSAVLTENTDQTSPNMGAVTGTWQLSGTGSCAVNGTYTLNSTSVHVGEALHLAVTDSGGVQVSGEFTVPLNNGPASGNVVFHGGSCDGIINPVTITKQ